MDDDTVLLDRLRSGDERAFELLVDRYDGGLRRVARTFVRSGAAVDDVVQETWLGVIRGVHAFEGRSSLRTWMFGILINQARTRARRDARSLPFSALEAEDGPTFDPGAFGTDGRWASAPARLDGDPETGLLSGELRAQLLRAVEALSDEQRAVITLRDLVGCSAGEVCELLDISDGNQRVLLHRAHPRAPRSGPARGGDLVMRFWRRRRTEDPLVCREFVELVTAYLEGSLPEGERARMDAHLAECDGCAGYLEDMRRLVGSLHEAPEPPADDATRDALLRAFRELRGEP